MKKCPYCAEEVQDEAVLCRYCHSNLQAQAPRPSPPPLQPQISTPPLAYAPPPQLDIPRVPVPVMILFTFLTAGFYVPIWFLRRREPLNRLQSPIKLDAWPFVLFLCFIVVADYYAWRFQLTGVAEPIVVDIFYFVAALVMIWQYFRTKDLIQDHLKPTGTTSSWAETNAAELSSILTFFFGPFYLQHILNTRLLSSPQGPDPSETPEENTSRPVGLSLH